MLEKIKNLDYKHYLSLVRDVRTVGLMIFVVLVLLVSWSGIKSIQTNYELQRRIARLEQEIEVMELENANAELRNQYLETDQFLELAARRQFGRAAPGEKLIIVTKEVALKNSVDSPKKEVKEKPKQAKKSRYQRNFEAWMNFFIRNELTVEI